MNLSTRFSKQRLTWHLAQAADGPLRTRLLALALLLGSALPVAGLLRDQHAIAALRAELAQATAAAGKAQGRAGDEADPPPAPAAALMDGALMDGALMDGAPSDPLQDALAKLAVIGRAAGFSRFRLSHEGRAGTRVEARVAVEALGTYAQIKDFLAAALNDDPRLAPVDLVIRGGEAGLLSLRLVVAVARSRR